MNYSHKDTLLIKGFAIFCIVFHNYFHWLYHATKENEFGFSSSNFPNMIAAITSSPQEILHAFFTYFGHFGVVLFIFISAYGLTKSHSEFNSYPNFIISRFKKIYPPVIIAIILWLVIFGRKQGVLGPIIYLGDNIESVTYVLLGISNLIPGYAMKPVGPWWFIPFILQFYLLFPLLIKLAKQYKYSMLVISIAGLLVNMFLNPVLIQHYQINLLFTPIGHLPEICLGIYSAKFRFNINLPIKLMTVTAFVLSNLYEHWWALHNFSALILLLWLYKWIKKLCVQYNFLEKSLTLFGRYSLWLFLINGFTRGAFVGTANTYNTIITDNLLSIANFLTCLALAILLDKADTYRKQIM